MKNGKLNRFLMVLLAAVVLCGGLAMAGRIIAGNAVYADCSQC